jgi:hypothetical protein
MLRDLHNLCREQQRIRVNQHYFKSHNIKKKLFDVENEIDSQVVKKMTMKKPRNLSLQRRQTDLKYTSLNRTGY